MRDFQVGATYWLVNSGAIEGEVTGVLGGPWNFMNGIAGILNILTITGWLGICIRKETAKDKSHDMLWPDMVWFWIVAYDLCNFAYTYNCLPSHSWYCGLALLLAPTCCAFTLGKGAWLQHRAQTLASMRGLDADHAIVVARQQPRGKAGRRGQPVKLRGRGAPDVKLIPDRMRQFEEHRPKSHALRR